MYSHPYPFVSFFYIYNVHSIYIYSDLLMKFLINSNLIKLFDVKKYQNFILVFIVYSILYFNVSKHKHKIHYYFYSVFTYHIIDYRFFVLILAPAIAKLFQSLFLKIFSYLTAISLNVN